MDIQPQTTQPISDDQELAKVLAGVNENTGATAATGTAMSDIVPPTAPSTPPPAATTLAADDSSEASNLPEMPEIAETPELSESLSAPVLEPRTEAMPAGELDSVKQEAIVELRPLVDKLNLSAEEKFDTYLLLIRSTDDKSLVAPAHEAAKLITDETRRAQALLDIIKEIDFLSQQ